MATLAEIVVTLGRIAGITEEDLHKAVYATTQATKHTFIKKGVSQVYAIQGDINKKSKQSERWNSPSSVTITIKGKALTLSNYFPWISPYRHDYPSLTGGYLNKDSRAKIRYSIRKGKTESMPDYIFTALGIGAYRVSHDNSPESFEFNSPWKKMLGPSVPDMVANEESGEMIGNDIADFLESRIDAYVDGVIGGN